MANMPQSIIVRAYQVGFGDCFLLTFVYSNTQRHVLIDCGSTGAPKSHGSGLLMRVAEDIKATCNGKLDAVVATHRHADHINGFERGGNDNPKSGDVLRDLKPELVIQPWTEDPKAKPDATKPTQKLPESHAFVRALAQMHVVSERTLSLIDPSRDLVGVRKRTLSELTFLGQDNIANKSAVENLMTMARTSKGQRYVSYGVECGLKALLPGVDVHVLGPPTVEQSKLITKQRATDEAEFWHLISRSLTDAAQSTGSHRSILRLAKRIPDIPPHARWLIPRIKDLNADQLLQLVRMLDRQMNNTSVILLFKVGKQRLLFPGDAQLENWMFALKEAPSPKRETTLKLLADTTLYKVGHHGSLNATPKTLWSLFKNRSTSPGPNRLVSMVSTMAGKHGHADDGTEVPRRPLVDALREETRFITTQDIRSKKDLCVEEHFATK